MSAGMKAVEERHRTGRGPAPVMRLFLLFLSMVLFSLPACKKDPVSPDAAVLERPIIWLSGTELTFTASEISPKPASQEIRIRNSGKNTLKYSISVDASWLSISPADGSSAGQANAHVVTVDASGMAGRDAAYTATITITCSDAYNNPQKASVALQLSKEPPPEISVSPTALTFSAQAGGSSPRAQTINIRNSGKSVLNYTISDDASWLDVNPTSGSSSGENKGHTVTVNSSGMSEGNYAATITIGDPKATNSPQKVSVTLQISKQPPPAIVVSRSSLSFSAQAGGGNPSAQTIGIRNGGGGTLTYTVSKDASWLSVSPTSGSSAGQENGHTISVNIAGLSRGSYPGTITVTSSGAANSPQTVGVTLQITAAGGSNQISVSCSPSQGVTGTTVSFPISISGNSSAFSAFGLQLTFDTAMFQYVGTTNGSLTQGWVVAGSEISGTVTLGGYAGTIAAGSSGTIAIITLKVTGGTYSNGKQSVVSIKSYVDGVAGMKPEPATTTFTYRK